MAKKGEVERQWWIVDATNKTLGRLASRIAFLLMGKHKPIYTPHVDCGDGVIVVNAAKVRVTGRKFTKKIYRFYSGYPGGVKEIPFNVMLSRHPEWVIKLAVKRMLPANRLRARRLARLKVYAGPDHPHQAQQPRELIV